MTNRRAVVLAAGALLCAASVAQAAATRTELSSQLTETAQANPFQRYLARVDAAIDATKDAGTDTAPATVATLSALIDDRLFALLTKPTQRSLVSAKALATWQQDQPEAARDLFLQATRIDGNDPDDWYRLAALERDLGDHARSARYMTALVTRWPELANNLDPQLLGEYIFRSDAALPARTALMQALFDANWNDRGNGVDESWRELALAHLADGNTAAADKVVERIGEPLTIVRIRSDKRFDALAASVQALPSVPDAADRRVEDLRRQLADSPKRVDLAASLGTALLVAGRHEEALAAADAMLAAMAADAPESFEKFEERMWVMNNRAIALRRLGRVDEAVAEIERASHIEEDGTPNVSQVLNLASFYCDLGRPADARRTVDRVGSMSGYGRMVLTRIRHCAALQTGDQPAAREALDYLLTHRSDSPAMVIEGLLRAGRIDEAAAALVARLEDPKDRDDALDFVQTFRTGPELAGNVAYNASRRALLARDDVRTAAERVGRLGVHEVFDITGME